MTEQANPCAARLDAPVVSKPSIAYKISGIFARNGTGLRAVFVFPQRRIRLAMVYMPVHLLWRRIIFIVRRIVCAVHRIHGQPLVFRHEAGVVVYYFMHQLYVRNIVLVVRIDRRSDLRNARKLLYSAERIIARHDCIEIGTKSRYINGRVILHRMVLILHYGLVDFGRQLRRQFSVSDLSGRIFPAVYWTILRKTYIRGKMYLPANRRYLRKSLYVHTGCLYTL